MLNAADAEAIKGEGGLTWLDRVQGIGWTGPEVSFLLRARFVNPSH